MIARETDADVAAKQEGITTDHEKTNSKASSSSASSWSRLKDPRIVRVSRAFGGKDRHSKVCTVRGLRDRRVRLSVPTAIQLYDLQDRLGLNQPSKVVDWLLNVAKHEIDKLPPLRMPPGSFTHNLQPVFASLHGVGAPQSAKEGLRIGSNINWDYPTEPSGSNNAWNSDAILRPNKSKEVTRGDSSEDKEPWTRNEEVKQQTNFESTPGAYFSSNNFSSKLGHSSSPSLGFLNCSVPYNSSVRWDPSNLSLSQSGSPRLTPQSENYHNFNVLPLPSTVSTPSGPQVLVYQPGITQSYFPSNIAAAAEYVPKQINFQMLNSSSENPLSNSLPPRIDATSQHVGRPFHLLSTTTKLHPSQNDSEGKERDENEFQSR